MKILFLATLVLLPLISLADTGCPGGWRHYNSKCYYFSRDALSMHIGLLVCQKFGGSLAEIDTTLENNYLTTQANITGQNYWIGLTDVQEEGIWRWYESNKKLQSSAVIDWGVDQPSSNGGGYKNCAFLSSAGHWEDAPCDNLRLFICEKPDASVNMIG